MKTDADSSQIDQKLRRMVVNKNRTLQFALKQLNECATGTLFVVDSDLRLVGVVTDGDIRRKLLQGVTLDSRVSEVTNRQFSWVHKGMLDDVYLARLDRKVRYLPIVDESGRLTDYHYIQFRPDIPVARPLLAGNEALYVSECISSNWISSQGRFVKRFEREFAEFCGVEHGIATCNGTAALHLALASLDIGPGDEVIVPSLTFVATANAVTYTGAKPVFVDSTMDTWTLAPDGVEKAVTPQTKAIIVVHLYGQPARMDEITAIARHHGIDVIEDAAEAHGATYKGRVVGGVGRMGCFSFFGNKILTTGEGGMVTTNDGTIAQRCRILRDHGMDPQRKYWHPWIGFNYRMTNLQAAVGCAQLERMDEILACKRRISQWYASRLSGVAGLIIPPRPDWSESVYWMFSVLVDPERVALNRDQLLKELEYHNIEGRPFFNPVHQMPPYATRQTLACAEQLSVRGLNLPSYVGITEEEVGRVCRVLIDLLAGSAQGRRYEA